MMPENMWKRLWQEAETRFAYVVLDGAQNKNLLDWLQGPEAPQSECLFASDLSPDMAEVAPYLVQLELGSRFSTEFLQEGWSPNWGILLTSSAELPVIWRHLRQHALVYGPDLEPMYFRFYDPRVFRMFLPTCDETQLRDFFGGVDFFIAEGESQSTAEVWSLADGKLIRESTSEV